MDMVAFQAPGLSMQATPDNNNGFNSPTGEGKPDYQAYTIPPVVWAFVFLLIGYIGVRWVMED